MANYQIHQGDNVDTLRQYEDCHFDAIITDPPYGIEFLGKDWDNNTGAVETWRQCLRVLKPGGHLLAFSAARTYHHLASNIESVGFEIRDQLMWLYASGFPKAQRIKNHEGWKTALKPAHEPIVMARKPFKGSTYKNMDTHGVGALNIDDSRIPFENNKDFQSAAYGQDKSKTFGYINTEQQDTYSKQDIIKVEANQQGRYPSNVMGEVEGYQKYFYCPKVSRKERHCGFEKPESQTELLASVGGYLVDEDGNPSNSGNQAYVPDLGMIYTHGINATIEKIRKQQNKESLSNSVGNNHPTVKPVALMRYLIQLVTPKNSVILDPFTGSGSTGMAACELGHTFVGCELDPAYVDIAKRRIEGWCKPNEPNTHPDTVCHNDCVAIHKR